MLTNPNTLGLFDENVLKVIETVHAAGGLVYGDGANLNALLGIARPGDLGFDVMHFNLHKTFSTPHGGGGPGSGPVGVAKHLAEFLPTPVVKIIEEGSDELPPLYGFDHPKQTIGRVKSFYGQFGMIVRAFTYIRMHGPDGLKKVSEYAVLNANYLLSKLQGAYVAPYKRICMHEFVLEGCWDDAPEIHALDVAKRLMDYRFHPPTNYFPLIVHEALMIEPTETESMQTLDAFADACSRSQRKLITSRSCSKKPPTILRSVAWTRSRQPKTWCCAAGSRKIIDPPNRYSQVSLSCYLGVSLSP